MPAPSAVAPNPLAAIHAPFPQRIAMVYAVPRRGPPHLATQSVRFSQPSSLQLMHLAETVMAALPPRSERLRLLRHA